MTFHFYRGTYRGQDALIADAIIERENNDGAGTAKTTTTYYVFIVGGNTAAAATELVANIRSEGKIATAIRLNGQTLDPSATLFTTRDIN